MSEAHPVPAPVTIRAETTLADPAVCRFRVSRVVHPGGPWFYPDAAAAAGSPLPERLFALPGVRHVLVADDVVTVGIGPDASWTELKPAIGAAIRSQLLSGIPPVFPAPAAGADGARSDGEIRDLVQALLDREVNRAIAAHGGRLRLVEVRDRTLYVAMEGGCQGCAASQVTLRQGFEVMARRVVPELAGIVDVTDHPAGQQPYYAKAP